MQNIQLNPERRILKKKIKVLDEEIEFKRAQTSVYVNLVCEEQDTERAAELCEEMHRFANETYALILERSRLKRRLKKIKKFFLY